MKSIETGVVTAIKPAVVVEAAQSQVTSEGDETPTSMADVGDAHCEVASDADHTSTVNQPPNATLAVKTIKEKETPSTSLDTESGACNGACNQCCRKVT